AAIEKGATYQTVTGGSQTARRMQGGGEGMQDARGVGEAIMAGEPAAAAGNLLKMLRGTLGEPSPAQEIDLARFLLSRQPDMAPLYTSRTLEALPENVTRGLLAPAVEASRETGVFGLLPLR